MLRLKSSLRQTTGAQVPFHLLRAIRSNSRAREPDARAGTRDFRPFLDFDRRPAGYDLEGCIDERVVWNPIPYRRIHRDKVCRSFEVALPFLRRH